ncbi:hypothetical protein EVAR_64936_1 [Eumeta japonica]|uniref:Uncharacterized protein n=1 Tax=Eumeta variegata TaxID=151549 RepID=A0A4C1ZBR9_EUMVA|nr:hypothetical protein EVAR_64936_1 [Eumeta japonica]
MSCPGSDARVAVGCGVCGGRMTNCRSRRQLIRGIKIKAKLKVNLNDLPSVVCPINYDKGLLKKRAYSSLKDPARFSDSFEKHSTPRVVKAVILPQQHPQAVDSARVTLSRGKTTEFHHSLPAARALSDLSVIRSETRSLHRPPLRYGKIPQHTPSIPPGDIAPPLRFRMNDTYKRSVPLRYFNFKDMQRPLTRCNEVIP